MLRRIAIALDESAEAARAFRSALELAKLASAELYAITVIESFPAYISYVSAAAPEMTRLLKDERRAFYEDLQARAKLEAEQSGIALHTELAEGSEIETILKIIDGISPDLLVVGLRHEPGLRLMGGTAHQLAVHAKCNMLGVR